jgi:hypothetical protein
VLTEADTAHFSIDGYDNASNNLYRVNSDFDSIITGIKELRASSQCRIVWAAIAFKFNEPYINSMQNLARQLDIDAFQLTKSTKFGSIYPDYGVDDPLEPSVNYVSSSHRFERNITILSPRGLNSTVSATNVRLYKSVEEANGVKPLCSIGNKGLYIDARGRLFPCCWVANRYSHNKEWQISAEQFNLNRRLLQDVLTDNFWQEEFKTFKWQECQTKCVASRVDEKYATEW